MAAPLLWALGASSESWAATKASYCSLASIKRAELRETKRVTGSRDESRSSLPGLPPPLLPLCAMSGVGPPPLLPASATDLSSAPSACAPALVTVSQRRHRQCVQDVGHSRPLLSPVQPENKAVLKTRGVAARTRGLEAWELQACELERWLLPPLGACASHILQQPHDRLHASCQILV